MTAANPYLDIPEGEFPIDPVWFAGFLARSAANRDRPAMPDDVDRLLARHGRGTIPQTPPAGAAPGRLPATTSTEGASVTTTTQPTVITPWGVKAAPFVTVADDHPGLKALLAQARPEAPDPTRVDDITLLAQRRADRRSTITVHGVRHVVPKGFDLCALIAAVEAGSDTRFVLVLPPSPRRLRNRRLVFVAADVDAIVANDLDGAVTS